MNINESFMIKSHATLQKDTRLSFLGTEDKDEDLPGLYKGIGTWLMTKPMMRPEFLDQNRSMRTF